MIRDFHFAPAYAWDELPLAQANAYFAWHVETMPWGCGVQRTTDGYIAQEAARASHR